MKPKYKRFWILLSVLVFFCAFVFFILANLSENISFFYSPTEVINSHINDDKEIRLGGSVKNIKKNLEFTSFTIYDNNNCIDVTYNGLAPKLMQEGIDVVVCGKFKKKVFNANQILIKHDERYYPKKN
jgi:cytochrome c-type biogenesis protein CcmE